MELKKIVTINGTMTEAGATFVEVLDPRVPLANTESNLIRVGIWATVAVMLLR